MKCKIIQDLLPLYCDKLTSEESNEEIENHLQDCAECTEVYENMKNAPADISVDRNLQPLKKVKRHYRMRLIILIAILALILLGLAAHKYLCLETPLCDMEDVHYSIEKGVMYQGYFYLNENEEKDMVLLPVNAEVVIDEASDTVYCDGEVVLSEDDMHTPVPANGKLMPYGYLELYLNVDSWTGLYTIDEIIYYDENYGYDTDPEEGYSNVQDSWLRFHPSLPSPITSAYAEISHFESDSTHTIRFSTPVCVENTKLKIECRDGMIVIDLHELALEHGIIAE